MIRFAVYLDCHATSPSACQQPRMSTSHYRGSYLNPFRALAKRRRLQRMYPQSKYFVVTEWSK